MKVADYNLTDEEERLLFDVDIDDIYEPLYIEDNEDETLESLIEKGLIEKVFRDSYSLTFNGRQYIEQLINKE